MDLIVSLSAYDLITGFYSFIVLGLLGSAILNFYSSQPLVQAVVNTTLVVLKNTEVVWKPAANAALVVLKPIVFFALTLLKPLGPLALVVIENVVKAVMVVGYTTIVSIRKVQEHLNSTFTLVQSTTVDMAYAIKDIAMSLGTLTRATGYILIRLIKATTFIVNSFEQVSDFLYRSLFETQTITWDELVSILFPFSIVASILGFLVWRMTRMLGIRSKAPPMEEEIFVPRRSSRLASLSAKQTLAREAAFTEGSRPFMRSVASTPHL